MNDLESIFHAPCIANRWTRILWPIFGKKIVTREGSHTLTAYHWRGRVYVANFK